MTELLELVKSGDNESQPNANSGYWMPLAEARRPHTPPKPCPKCGGQLQIEYVLPGLYDVTCFTCGEFVGEVLESDLRRWVGPRGMVYAETHLNALLWDRDDTDEP